MKALAIDPDYAPAHAQLGWIAMYGDNDLAGAAEHFERALALDPANLNVLGNSASLLAVVWAASTRRWRSKKPSSAAIR